MKKHMLLRLALGAGLALALSAGAAHAQYPSGQITIVVDSSAGGGKDTLARLVAERLGKRLDVNVIVENKGGAGGLIGVESVATAEPNGQTLLLTGMSSTISPHLYGDIAFDPVADLQPIASLMSLPFVLVTSPDFPAASLAEFEEYVRSDPTVVNVASAGSTTTVAAALWFQQNELEPTFIAYQGSGPTTAAMLSGEVQVFFGDLPSVAQYVASGQLKALAVSSPERSPLLPEVPTAAESGEPDYVVTSWYGIMAPAGTPDETVQLLNDALNEIIVEPDMVEHIAQLGGEPLPQEVEPFTALYQDELTRWKGVVERGNITP